MLTPFADSTINFIEGRTRRDTIHPPKLQDIPEGMWNVWDEEGQLHVGTENSRLGFQLFAWSLV